MAKVLKVDGNIVQLNHNSSEDRLTAEMARRATIVCYGNCRRTAYVTDDHDGYVVTKRNVREMTGEEMHEHGLI